ncbi:hypothetical protein Dcar01_00978 [Deinococcus carri]|uniref:Uncharacterized protein n=1 Tax=Deinococcus carri TaxID=1211323 RepID=A0ABP9W4L1_9DEIO
MPTVVEVWLADDLAGLEDHPLPRLHAELHRCARETGWHLQPFSASPPDKQMESFTLQGPHGGAGAELRFHRVVPVLGFVDAQALQASLDVWASSWVAWGHSYINPPPLVAWWQAAGWLTPDAAWLNASPTPEDLRALGLLEGPEWKRSRQLSRGDALFFEW